jgi:hypothetical protein
MRQLKTLKRHNWAFNQALTKVLVTHKLDGNHPHKKIIKENKENKN